MAEPSDKPKASGKVAVGHPIDVASGVFFQELEDYVLPGRMPLVWSRRYSSGLLGKTPVGMFGPCWTSPFEMRLSRDLDGYRLIAADGETEITFDDPQDVLSSSGVLRNLGAFHELRAEGSELVVTTWDPEEHEVERYRFEPTLLGSSYRLRSKESSDGQAIDVIYNNEGRISRLRQRRERRCLILTYDQRGRVIELRVAGPRTIGNEQEHETAGRLLWAYRYDEAGRLCEATDALDQHCSYAYDETGRLIREVLLGGMVYHFSYDADGRCIQSTGLDGFAQTTLKFDPQARVTRVTNSQDQVTTYIWNERGQVEKEISPLGHQNITAFDELGRIVGRIKPSGAATAYKYDKRGNLHSTTEPPGAVTYFEHNERHELVAVIDPAGFRWSRAFDECGRLLWVENPLGARTSYSYTSQGDPCERRSPLGNVVAYRWDGEGNLRTICDALGHATHYEYDEEGLLTALTEPGSEAGKPGPRTELRRDRLGRVTEVRLPDGARRRFAYHPTDQVTQYVDENGAVTRWRYLLCGFLSEELKPLGMRVQYHWGSEPGLLQAITNEVGERYTFAYDVEGRVASETDFGGRVTGYRYDRDGNISATINAAQQQTRFLRDASGALLDATYHDGTQVKLAYDPRGLLVRAENPDSVVEREYDALGRLVCERTTHGGNTREVRSEYDADGRRIRRQSSLGYEVLFEWNPNDQLSALRPAGQEPIHFEYAPDGSELARYIKDGVRIEQRHDARGRVIEQSAGLRDPITGRVAVGGPDKVHRSYRYDPAGNLLEVQDARWGQTRYEYDANGRITSRVDVGRWSEMFEYDPADNLRRVGEFRSDPTTRLPQRAQRDFSYRQGNQLERVNGTAYEFDALGQLIRRVDEKGTTRFEWNAQGMLARAILSDGAVWHYTYDALARRLAKQGPDKKTEFVWDGDVVLHEVCAGAKSSSDLTIWEFEPWGFVPIAKIEKDHEYLSVNDINGAPLYLLGHGGRDVWISDRSTYGRDRFDATRKQGTSCSVRFQGQWFDPETQLCYNRNRYYDPCIGCYLSIDPVGLHGGNNAYSYTANTLEWIDPYGLAKKRRPSCSWITNPNTNTKHARNLTEWRRSIKKRDLAKEREKFLGQGYFKVDKGTWRSNDGSRQFRSVPADYLGRHGIGDPLVPNTPHVHFEFLAPPNPGGTKPRVLKNVHVPIED